MKKSIEELIKYGVYGVFTTGINLILFVVFKEIGMYYLVANTVSYIIAVVINYVLNRKFVFKTAGNTKQQAKEEFLKFVGVRCASLVLDNILFYFVVDIMKINVYVGRIFLSIGIILCTFIINKVFVFKKRQ